MSRVAISRFELAGREIAFALRKDDQMASAARYSASAS
jgi:hypothetical protein